MNVFVILCPLFLYEVLSQCQGPDITCFNSKHSGTFIWQTLANLHSTKRVYWKKGFSIKLLNKHQKSIWNHSSNNCGFRKQYVKMTIGNADLSWRKKCFTIYKATPTQQIKTWSYYFVITLPAEVNMKQVLTTKKLYSSRNTGQNLAYFFSNGAA